MIRSPFLAIVAGFLAGCASGPTIDYSAVLQAAPECCKSFAEMKFEALAANSWTTTDISPSAPAFLFREGKSYFKSFSLPSAASKGVLRVKSFSIYPDSLYHGHLFLPRFTFLDARYSITRTIAPRLRENRPVIGNTAWEGEIPMQAGESFLVVHTGSVERATEVRMYDPDVGAVYVHMPRGGGVLIGNPKGNRVVPIGPTGKLELQIDTK